MPATPAWPPKSAPRLFVDTPLAKGDVRLLEGNAARYIGTVMRKQPGDAVLLCDDVSGEWLAVVRDVSKRHVALSIEERLRAREDVPDLWLCAALLKKPHFDMVLEKATELGVARIVPVVTRRCVADKLNPERGRAIIIEAAEQCARTALPQLAPVQTLPQLLAEWPADRALIFADENGGGPASDVMPPTKGQPAAILIGPEGGFDDAERTAIRALAQSHPIGLGPRILRAETAVIATISLWQAMAGDWG